MLLDPLAPKAHPGMTAPKAARAPSDFLGIPAPPENLAPRVRTAPLVTKETMVNRDRRDPPALLVSLDRRGLPEKGVPPAPQALKADRERRVLREKPAWKALLGRLAPSAPRAPLGSRGPTACAGSRALWVNKVSRGHQALTVPRAPWAPPASPASKAILAPKVKRVIPA